MSQFEDFAKKHGPAADCRAVPASRFDAYRHTLPETLIAEWREKGWCAYGDGLLWIVDPDELRAPVKEWLGSAAKAAAFARSGFGHLLLWDDEGAHLLDPHYGTIAKLIDDVGLVFNYTLCEDRYLNRVLEMKLFRKARAKLGPLAFDECFGFEPAIALGGPGTLATVRKLKLREHLSILANLVAEVQRI